MVFVPIPNTVECEIRGNLAGVPVENTIYWLSTTDVDASVVEDLAGSTAAWYVDQMLPLIGEGYTFNSVLAKDLSAQNSYQFEDFTGNGTAGGDAGTPLPNNVTWAIKFVTGTGGRSFRGRNYIPSLTVPMVSTNTLSGVVALNFVAAYKCLLTTAKPAGADWVVASRYSANAPRVTGLATLVTDVGYSDLRTDSMRGRLPKTS